METKIEITDVDKNLDRSDQFMIEVNGVRYYEVEVVDFVAYLYKMGEVDNYDAENGIAIVEHTSEMFNHQTQEFEESYEAESMTFQKVLDKYFMDNETLEGFVKDISLIVDQVAQAA
jgi:adenylosuccinate synthase